MPPGTIEMVNAFGSLGLGAWLTMRAQASKDLHEERLFRGKTNELIQESAESARNHVPAWSGFYWVRAALAGVVGSYLFLFPIIAVLWLQNVQIAIGFYETFSGFFSGDQTTVISWIKFGSAAPDAKVIVYDPVKNNIAISVFSFYFGNQFARRN